MDRVELQNLFGDFLYGLDENNNLSKIEFFSERKMLIGFKDGTEIKIVERTPYKMFTRAIYEVMNKVS